MIRVRASRDYDIQVERGLLSRYGDYLDKDRRYFLISDKEVYGIYGENLERSLKNHGISFEKALVCPGEGSKSMKTAESILNKMVEAGINREDAVLAFGGGVVGDLSGFVAGIYMRGISYIQLPTSLLAAVDSSVGGKTAVNLSSGKNLAGIFLQPDLVLIDPDLILSMDSLSFSSGLAEVVKYSLLMSPDLFSRLKKPLKKDSSDMEDIIESCIRFKAEIVEEDERDRGRRSILNLGHTAGHAIEKLSDFEIGHGQAVSIGIAIIARACERLGILKSNRAKEIEEVLEVNGLPVRTNYGLEEIFKISKSDKKAGSHGIRAVLIRDIGDCFLKDLTFDEWRRILEAGLW